jgi:hypothetical protein
MERATWVEVHTTAFLEGNGPIEFSIVGSQEEYLDLNDTVLYVRVKLVKSDGGNLDAAMRPFTANLALTSLFSDVTLSLNDTIVEGGHYLYPYKSYMSDLLQFDDGMKGTQLKASGYQPDKDTRIAWFTGSRSREFMGVLSNQISPTSSECAHKTNAQQAEICTYERWEEGRSSGHGRGYSLDSQSTCSSQCISCS